MNNFCCSFSEKSSYLCHVVLDSSRDDWNQVEASKPMLANERLSFWKAFFVCGNKKRISAGATSSAVERL